MDYTLLRIVNNIKNCRTKKGKINDKSFGLVEIKCDEICPLESDIGHL